MTSLHGWTPSLRRCQDRWSGGRGISEPSVAIFRKSGNHVIGGRHYGARIRTTRGGWRSRGYQTWWRSGRDSNSRTELPRLRHFQCRALDQLGDRSAALRLYPPNWPRRPAFSSRYLYVVSQDRTARYGDRVATLEPYSIEHIPAQERHGQSRQLLWLWLAANLTIADYALGFVPVSLGLPLPATLLALAVGNILGGALLAWSAAMGPSAGYPQMFIGRRPFGRIGGYLPAALNWLSTAGWFTVNTILGAFAVKLLVPMPFPIAALILVAVQTLITIYGHNFIQAFERWMAAVLGVLFAVATVIALSHGTELSAWRPSSSGSLPLFGIVLAASFSYIMSWSPYASDYSRYLPERTSRRRVALFVFIGAAVASFWLEVLGALVAILGAQDSTPVGALASVMGGFGKVALLAIILGATTANALNLYSNTLSARVLDLPWPRWSFALVGAALGFVVALLGYQNFVRNYINFLLLLDYWIMPWLAVLFVDFFWLRQQQPAGFAGAPAWNRRGLLAYLIGLAASVPFMSEQFFHGPLASLFGTADLSYFVGFLVAGTAYVLLNRAALARGLHPAAA